MHDTNGYHSSEQEPHVNGHHVKGEDNLDTPPPRDTPLDNGIDGRTKVEESETPPAKRRKLADTNGSIKLPRPISPPWKRVAAEGPTSFTLDGRRKSGRTNAVPLELQPQSKTRQTRAAFGKAAGDQKSQKPTYSVSQRKQTATQQPSIKTTPASASTKRVVTPKNNKESHHAPRARSKSHQRSRSKSGSMPSKTSKVAELEAQLAALKNARRTMTNGHDQESTDESSEESDDSAASVQHSSTPLHLRKVNFRVHLPKPTIVTPANIPTGKKYVTFEEFLAKDDTEYRLGVDVLSTEQIQREAAMRNRVYQARKRGGVLHGNTSRASINASKPINFDHQYSHRDHLNVHAGYFYKLMVSEHRTHKKQAEIIAHEAKRYVEAKALQNRVKTVEELEHEAFLVRRAAYRTVVKDVDKLWAAVLDEVEAMRRKEYEDEKQAENKRHLERVLDRTTQMLAADAEDSILDSADATDEDSENDDGIDGSDDGSDNSEQMSDSTSDSSSHAAPEDNDADLSVEQLRAKYENLPDLEKSMDADVDMDSNPASPAVDDDESDPETEMDSEFDSDGSEDDDEESGSDAEEAEEDSRGLLGLFFSKKELKEAAADEEPSTPTVGDDEAKDTSEQATRSSPLIEELPTDADTPMQEAVNGAGDDETMGRATEDAEPTQDRSETQQAVAKAEIAMTPDRQIGESPSSAASPQTSVTGKASAPESMSSVEPPVDPLPQEANEDKTSSIKTPVPKLLRGVLRTYQHEGLDWMATLYANGRSGILADEMGLGKTIQSIALLAHLAEVHEVWGPHLIVVPTSVMLNWEMEFKKFLPGFKILTYYGSIEERKNKRRGWLDENSFNVCITSYQLVLQDQASFKRRAWQYMILDEAHNIKNFRSDRWQTMMTFNTQARLLLTGTPLQNNLTELWSLLFFLHYGQETNDQDDAFAGLKEWSEWFKKPVESIMEQNKQVLDAEDKEQVSKLHKVIRPFLLRRLKADVEKQMPLKYEHVELCRLSKRQRQLYDGFMSRAQTKETLASGNYLSIINALMQLRKVCNHPDLFETRPINTSFAMSKSVASDFDIQNLLIQRRTQKAMADKVNLDFLQLVPICRENLSYIDYHESTGHHAFHQIKSLRDKQNRRIDHQGIWSGESRLSVLQSLDNVKKQARYRQLDQLMYQEAYRHHAHPVYGRGLIEKLTCETTYDKLAHLSSDRIMTKFWEREIPVESLQLVQSIDNRSRAMQPLVEKYACITPAAVANDMSSLAVTDAGAVALRQTPAAQGSDPFHEARMKLSIAFPDKRLLQYDCGKLQRLDQLLRKLQAGGHRALIFTQMTKVLDILEQFLNIHGHRYLRLDGATKIEQRQLLTERFNNDKRILAFILSSRSGGLGINLTGADTVIFYDLDWNPAMDKQCTDRAHRIGQTRDVHIYRFVSEHTIESNILRKANQKQLLDDVVIQEGDFTTDYLNKTTYRDMLDDAPDDDDVAGAAMDRVLGNDRTNATAFEQAEEREDIVAAKEAAKEDQHADDGDFEEKAAATEASSKAQTPGPGAEVNDDEAEHHIDNYMIKLQRFLLRDVPLAPPKDRSKKGKRYRDEHRVRRR
ncbi:Helicase swr1 [Cyphellophora attinorum]|uniref:DNA helicase n=1 Tax=Cyphellophora attinorum TaxID=1664694 RepID=A0A0N1HFB3_9EURO|nr:Helicase swr1 [Phialophora attinorum]KPI43846.1 Helicase swr1 [Phialophora attinorum]